MSDTFHLASPINLRQPMKARTPTSPKARVRADRSPGGSASPIDALIEQLTQTKVTPAVRATTVCTPPSRSVAPRHSAAVQLPNTVLQRRSAAHDYLFNDFDIFSPRDHMLQAPVQIDRQNCELASDMSKLTLAYQDEDLFEHEKGFENISTLDPHADKQSSLIHHLARHIFSLTYAFQGLKVVFLQVADGNFIAASHTARDAIRGEYPSHADLATKLRKGALKRGSEHKPLAREFINIATGNRRALRPGSVCGGTRLVCQTPSRSHMDPLPLHLHLEISDGVGYDAPSKVNLDALAAYYANVLIFSGHRDVAITSDEILKPLRDLICARCADESSQGCLPSSA